MKDILILTDDFTIYGKYRSLLEDGNVDISHRASVQEAMIYTRNEDVDLIIVDLDLPKFRTKHVNPIRKLRKRSKVINIVNDIAERALTECVDIDVEVLKKPFKSKSLVISVKMILNSINNDDAEDDEDEDNSCILDNAMCDIDNYAAEG